MQLLQQHRGVPPGSCLLTANKRVLGNDELLCEVFGEAYEAARICVMAGYPKAWPMEKLFAPDEAPTNDDDGDVAAASSASEAGASDEDSVASSVATTPSAPESPRGRRPKQRLPKAFREEANKPKAAAAAKVGRLSPTNKKRSPVPGAKKRPPQSPGKRAKSKSPARRGPHTSDDSYRPPGGRSPPPRGLKHKPLGLEKR